LIPRVETQAAEAGLSICDDAEQKSQHPFDALHLIATNDRTYVRKFAKPFQATAEVEHVEVTPRPTAGVALEQPCRLRE
jgi:hypothetical protein